MSAVTALVQIGSPHPNRGGLRTASQLQLEEGARPAYTLRRPWHSRSAPPRQAPAVIPTLENTLEDGLLLIAHQFRLDPEVVRIFDERLASKTGAGERPRLEMYEDFSLAERHNLYACLAGSINEAWPKLCLCLYRGSLLTSQVDRMRAYRCSYEVLLPAYGQDNSWWSNAPRFWQQGEISIDFPNL